jgi:hypothetical protein
MYYIYSIDLSKITITTVSKIVIVNNQHLCIPPGANTIQNNANR